MKLSTVLALLAISAAVCGCRYNKAGEGAGAGEDGSTTGSDIIGSDLESGNIEDLQAGARFADKYTLCSDVNFQPVYFALNAANLAPDELAKVDAVISHLNENGDRVVSIEGNCDERGSNEYNMSLGSRRAEIVRDFMLNSGIAADRIETISNGEEKPAVAGSGESFWSKNRRDEFLIYKK